MDALFLSSSEELPAKTDNLNQPQEDPVFAAPFFACNEYQRGEDGRNPHPSTSLGDFGDPMERIWTIYRSVSGHHLYFEWTHIDSESVGEIFDTVFRYAITGILNREEAEFLASKIRVLTFTRRKQCQNKTK